MFLLSRVTLKNLRDVCTLEGLPQINQKTLLGSNIYSLPESILLAWLTENLHKRFPDEALRVTNFDSDLRNGVVLFALFINHWPSAEKYVQSFTRKPVRDAQIKGNVDIIVQVIQVCTHSL